MASSSWAAKASLSARRIASGSRIKLRSVEPVSASSHRSRLVTDRQDDLVKVVEPFGKPLGEHRQGALVKGVPQLHPKHLMEEPPDRGYLPSGHVFIGGHLHAVVTALDPDVSKSPFVQGVLEPHWI